MTSTNVGSVIRFHSILLNVIKVLVYSILTTKFNSTVEIVKRNVSNAARYCQILGDHKSMHQKTYNSNVLTIVESWSCIGNQRIISRTYVLKVLGNVQKDVELWYQNKIKELIYRLARGKPILALIVNMSMKKVL